MANISDMAFMLMLMCVCRLFSRLINGSVSVLCDWQVMDIKTASGNTFYGPAFSPVVMTLKSCQIVFVVLRSFNTTFSVNFCTKNIWKH